jgi:hypothetical protein
MFTLKIDIQVQFGDNICSIFQGFNFSVMELGICFRDISQGRLIKHILFSFLNGFVKTGLINLVAASQFPVVGVNTNYCSLSSGYDKRLVKTIRYSMI